MGKEMGKETAKEVALYRHYDAGGTLLYVGISLSATYRLSQHKLHSGWFKDIARVEIERCETREEAFEKESLAIATENPTHNRNKRVIKPVPLVREEDSRRDLVHRIVRFDPTYSLTQAALVLGVGESVVKKWIAAKKLGYIVIGHTPKGNEKRYITGWQLIDFIECLEKH